MTKEVSALVQVVDLSKRYDEAAALQPTNFEIVHGQTTVLIGPSGCGKSTLLRLIIGLTNPDSGEILFRGEKIDIDAFRRRTGYVIQEGGLFPHLTARGNVLLLARHLRTGRRKLDWFNQSSRRGEETGRETRDELDCLKQSSLQKQNSRSASYKLDWFNQSSSPLDDERMEKRLRELCQLTRFPEALLDRYPLELSGGQRQRVSLMRALMLEPELLLLDEPLGALDPLVRAGLQRDLKEIFARLQQTVLLVTHDLAEAAYLGDNIVLMNEGRIVQQGSIVDLRERPTNEFVSDFINAQKGLIQI